MALNKMKFTWFGRLMRSVQINLKHSTISGCLVISNTFGYSLHHLNAEHSDSGKTVSVEKVIWLNIPQITNIKLKFIWIHYINILICMKTLVPEQVISAINKQLHDHRTLWDAIVYPCLRYLLLTRKSLYPSLSCALTVPICINIQWGFLTPCLTH